MELTHLGPDGKAVMVCVGGKGITERAAEARAEISMKPETLKLIRDNALKKGDALACARIAGIQAAKRTWELIPLCHNIPIESVTVDFNDNGDDRIYITARASCTYKTGIEMEALTAVSVAALTVYDMCKAVDRSMSIENVRLIEKTGGKSGDFRYEG